MAKKSSKKNISKEIQRIEKEIKKTKSQTYIKVPLIGFIVLLVLLVGISVVACFFFLKGKNSVDNSTTGNTKLTSNNVFNATKTNKPELDFYVMSFCPYGNMIEDTLRPVFDLLGDKVTLRPRYIFEKVEGSLSSYCSKNNPDPANCATYVKNSNGQLKDINDCKNQIATMVKTCNDESKYLKIGNNFYTSLHGRIEANQDVRELCAYNLSNDKKTWWDFIDNVNINCTSQNADTCWEEQAKKAGLDTNKITECFNKDASKLIDEEIAATTKNKVSGSPTLYIGDQLFPPEAKADSTETNIKIGKEVFALANIRTSNVIKAAICSAFNKAPKACDTVLKEAAAKTAAPATGGCN